MSKSAAPQTALRSAFRVRHGHPYLAGPGDTAVPLAARWVYWSVAAGLAIGLLILFLAEVWPLPQHGHHMSITDAFDIAWKVALFPPGIVTGRSRGHTFLSAA